MFQMINTMPFSLTSILFIYLGQGIQFLLLSLLYVCMIDNIGLNYDGSFKRKFGCEGQFMHPKLPTPSLKWLSCDDL